MGRHCGKPVGGGLEIVVRGEASLRDLVTVNGQPAVRAGSEFSATVTLREMETDILAVSEGPRGRQEHRVRVVRDRATRNRYRFAMDDNIFFLRDIVSLGCSSLFDCFYLRALRDLHRAHGTKFVLNIYFTDGEGFDLPQFPDRYKGEWGDNSDWLRLAFHAHADKPDRPYQHSSKRLAEDFDRVAVEILRFAGEEAYSPSTLIHWAMVQPGALPTLAERGVRALSGLFRRRNGGFDGNYFLDDERSEWMTRNEALKDFETGIVFSKVDLICNSTLPGDIAPALEGIASDPHRAGIMDLMTHEQYFWPHYHAHLPDHVERVETALRWVSERGYEPVFLHEGLLGADPADGRALAL